MKILVVGPSWVGDMVMAQSLFKRLRARHAELALHVLAPSWCAALLQRMPEVDVVIENPFGHGALAVGGRRRFAHQLKAGGYDQAIVLPNSFKSALIPWFAGIALRTGYIGELRYGVLNDARKLDKRALPLMVERFALLAEKNGSALPRPVPKPSLAPDLARQRAALARLNLDDTRPIAAFCPGAEYGPAKRWPAEHFATLAQTLAQRGYQIWLFGSARDAAIAAQIQRAAGGACADLCGHTDLGEAVDLLALATWVVSNDSGLMHVAAALDKPLAALYGSSSPAFTPPLSDQAKVVSLNLACSPCFKRECPLGHLNCLRQLTPERVAALAPAL